jgi:hypothetical protein
MSVWRKFLDRMGGLFRADMEYRSLADEDIEIPSEIADLAEAARRRLDAAGHMNPAEERDERLEARPIGSALALGLNGPETKKQEDDALRRNSKKRG